MIQEYFASLSAGAAAAMILAGWVITNILKTDKAFAKQITVWVIAVGIAFFGDNYDLGFYAGADTIGNILNGIATGLVANGIFDVKIVQEFLQLIKAKPAVK